MALSDELFRRPPTGFHSAVWTGDNLAEFQDFYAQAFPDAPSPTVDEFGNLWLYTDTGGGDYVWGYPQGTTILVDSSTGGLASATSAVNIANNYRPVADRP